MNIEKQDLIKLLEKTFLKGCDYNTLSKDKHEAFEKYLLQINEVLAIRKKCKYCGEYFYSYGRSNKVYCDNVAPGETKPCSEIASAKKWKEKSLKNPINKLFDREYKKRNARIRYKIMSKEDFKKWSQQARQQRDKCLNGEITYDEFQNWLNQ